MAGELEAFLGEWAERRKVGAPRRDADGKHFFVFDGEFEVAFSQFGQSIYLETELVPLPARREAAETFLERLLKLQLARAGSGQEVVSMAPESDVLILFRTLRADRIQYLEFERAMGEFVNAAAFWMKKLGSVAQDQFIPGPMNAQIFYP